MNIFIPEIIIDFLKKFKCIKDKLNNYEIRESINNAQINSKNIIIISGIKIFIQRMNINKNLLYMQNYVDHLRNIIGSCIVVLGGLLNKKAIIIVALTKDLSVKINAKYIIHKLAKIIDGTGGGKTEFAQAGGSNYNNLDKALSLAKKIITKLIIS